MKVVVVFHEVHILQEVHSLLNGEGLEDDAVVGGTIDVDYLEDDVPVLHTLGAPGKVKSRMIRHECTNFHVSIFIKTFQGVILHYE